MECEKGRCSEGWSLRREDVQRGWECEKGGCLEGSVRREDVQKEWSVRRADVHVDQWPRTELSFFPKSCK